MPSPLTAALVEKLREHRVRQETVEEVFIHPEDVVALQASTGDVPPVVLRPSGHFSLFGITVIPSLNVPRGAFYTVTTSRHNPFQLSFPLMAETQNTMHMQTWRDVPVLGTSGYIPIVVDLGGEPQGMTLWEHLLSDDD